MALDRTWYNTLVDDDGSGLTGSVWDKADVNSLMNAVDAEIARGDARFASGLWTPSLTTIAGGTAVGNAVGIYQRVDKLVQVSGSINLSSKGSLVNGSGIVIAGLPFAGAGNAYQGGFSFGSVQNLNNAMNAVSGFMDPGASRIGLTFWAAGGGTTMLALVPEYITATFSVIFGGTYRTA